MADYEDRERFIPINKNELTDLLIDSSDIEESDAKKFRNFSKLLAAYYHFEYHDNLENLKTLYEPFDPDADTISQKEFPNKKEMKQKLFEEFGETCEAANYVEMSDEELNEAFEGWTPFGLNLKLDLDDYEKFSLYYRGSVEETHMIRVMPKIWKQVPFTTKIYKRLAILIKIKETDKFKKKYNSEKILVKLFKNVPALDLEMLFPTTKPAVKPLDFVQIYLPVLMGIAMLIWKLVSAFLIGAALPQPSFIKTLNGDDKAKIAKFEERIKSENIFLKYEANPIEDGTAIKGKIPQDKIDDWAINMRKLSVDSFNTQWSKYLLDLSNKDAGAEPIVMPKEGYELKFTVMMKNDLGHALWRGLLAGGIVFFLILFASWTFKSFLKFMKMKQKYVGTLAQNLFFLNLDNNFGVFSNLIYSAEEEEWKEAAFAYFFLNTIKDRTFNEEELDDFIENWVETNCKQKVMNTEGQEEERPILIDFEIEDAIRKLEELKLLTREKDGDKEIVKVLPWDKALERVDYLWDNFFEYNAD
ncbi:MAG: DUF3754 domain-containing protein [Planctomycetes bacterium]|nr:DUF3754 domain-containing protein [Planctomycetota bacterium]